MKKLGKKILVMSLLGSLSVTSLAGCGKKEDKEDKEEVVYTPETASATDALKVGEEDISIAEVLAYAVQYVYVQNVTSDTMDAELTKDSIIDSLRQTKLIYNVAINNGYELPDGYMQSAETTVDNVMKMFDEDFFEKYGITKEVFRKVFIEQCYVEAYSSYIKNDMNEKITADMTAACEKIDFVKLYYVRFPLIELDEQGEALTDEEGNYIKLSEEEKLKTKEAAENAIKEITDGKDVAEVIASYGVSDYSQETNGYIGGYSDEVNEALKGMKEGECSEIFEDEVSYLFIVMMDEENDEAKEAYIGVQTQEVLEEQFAEVQKKWLQTIPIDNENDFYGTEWADFDISQFVDDLNENRNK